MKKKTLAAASLLLALLMPLGATPLAVYADEVQTGISDVSEDPKGTGETNKDPEGTDETNEDPKGTGSTNEDPEGTGETNEAPEGTGETKPLEKGQIRVQTDAGSKTYNNADNVDNFRAAMMETPGGSTIELGEGTYSLYKSDADDAWDEMMKGKTFTFVGQSPQKTFWRIGAEEYQHKGGEYDSDYSFKGSQSVTFRNMKLYVPYDQNYLGFSHTNDTVVEDCIIEGRTAYWGYKSAKFINTVFTNTDDYVMWDYSSPFMSFDGCTFNVRSGKVINVFREASKGTQENPLILNFNNCTVNSTGGYWGSSWFGKSVLNIKDSNNVYQVNISGNNTINGVGVNSTTCSRLFQVESVGDGKPYYATVNIDGTTVWQNGKMVSHSIDTTNDKYTDGYKDGKVYNVYGAWSAWTEDANVPHLFHRTRTVNEKCHYCSYNKPLDNETETENAYLLHYDLNGGTGAEGVDYSDNYYFEPTDGNKATVAAAPSRAGYQFAGWQDKDGNQYAAGDAVTVNHDITLTAQWNKLVTVSFDLCGHGGANISSQTFVSGNKASEPTAPKEDGWVFGGWYTEKGCKYRFSFDSAVTSDITLYAKWDRVTTVVSAPVATPTPSPAPAAAATKTATVKNAAIPQTSDAFPMEGLLALLAVGAVGFGAAGWLRKKHH